MSTNCINCVVNKLTGPDLLCDACRMLAPMPELATDIMPFQDLVGRELDARILAISKQATKHAIELVDTVSKERDAWKAMAKNLLVGFKQYADEVCSCTFDHDLNECTHVCLEHKLMNEFQELDKP